MKKTLVALAVLGTFAGAASAQSSVTLYGRLDTSVVYQEPGTGDGAWKQGGNAPIGGSRWGLKGTEDLGSGLKANFVLESGFDVDTGVGNAKLFNRSAWVGIASASLGEVRLGRQQTLTRELDLFTVEISAEGELTIIDDLNRLSGTAKGKAPLFQNFGTRVDNAVSYISPNFSGFQLRALVAAGEGATARQQGVSATYAAGPIKAGLSYETYDQKGIGSYNEVVTAGASYNFGVATVALGYQNTSDFGSSAIAAKKSGIDHDAYNVGVMVPFDAFEFRAQYTSSKIKPGAGMADFKQDKYGASVRYSLSKRTQIYGVITQRGGDFKSTYEKETEYALGIGHNF